MARAILHGYILILIDTVAISNWRYRDRTGDIENTYSFFYFLGKYVFARSIYLLCDTRVKLFDDSIVGWSFRCGGADKLRVFIWNCQ